MSPKKISNNKSLTITNGCYYIEILWWNSWWYSPQTKRSLGFWLTRFYPKNVVLDMFMVTNGFWLRRFCLENIVIILRMYLYKYACTKKMSSLLIPPQYSVCILMNIHAAQINGYLILCCSLLTFFLFSSTREGGNWGLIN
jgi:hypothetical protein